MSTLATRACRATKAQSLRWYTAAANAGEVSAMYALATKYHDGDGVPKDLAQAARWQRAAADKATLTPC